MSDDEPRWSALIHAHLDGAIAPAEAAALDRALVADPAVAARFVALSRQHHDLHRLLGGGRGEAAGAAETISRRLERAQSRVWRTTTRIRRRPARRSAWWVATVAAAVLVLAVGWLLRAAPVPAALVVHAGPDARLTRGDRLHPMSAGDRIRSGDRIAAGSEGVGLHYPGGALVELDRSTTAEVDGAPGPDHLRLRDGGAHAETVSGERPLLLSTALAEVRPRGGRVDLTASSDDTRVAVLSGEAELMRRTDGSTTVLGAGRSVRIDAAGGPLVFDDQAPGASGAVVALRLIDGATNAPVPGYDPLTDGVVVDLARMPSRNLNIQAVTMPPTVGSVVFVLEVDGVRVLERVEVHPPYAMAENSLRGNFGAYGGWTATPGRQVLTATPYARGGGRGRAGTPLRIAFTVVDSRTP